MELQRIDYGKYGFGFAEGQKNLGFGKCVCKAGEKSNQTVEKAGLFVGALPSIPSDQGMDTRVCYFVPSKQPCG